MKNTLLAALLVAIGITTLPSHAQRLVKQQTYEWTDDSTTPAVECRTRRWEYDYIGIDSGGLWYEPSPVALLSKASSGGAWIVRQLADGEDAETVLRTLEGRSEVWMRDVEEPSSEWFVNESVADDLVWWQWVSHWCVDEDGDGYCDSITMPDGETTMSGGFVPMNPQERNHLAQCLNRTRQTKSRVVRRDHLVSGAPDWPALASWHDSCAVDAPEHRVPRVPDEPTDRLGPAEWCAAFFDWRMVRNAHLVASSFSEGGSHAYMCDLSKTHNLHTEYTGRQVRNAWDDAVGEFAGFQCPDDDDGGSGSSGALTVHEMRYDTSGLREPPPRHDDTSVYQMPARTSP